MHACGFHFPSDGALLACQFSKGMAEVGIVHQLVAAEQASQYHCGPDACGGGGLLALVQLANPVKQLGRS